MQPPLQISIDSAIGLQKPLGVFLLLIFKTEPGLQLLQALHILIVK